MPRVVAGELGGIPLKAPKGDKVRPTADRTKEAIFSMLADLPESSRFLDLFAGTGQMGIEALSRGAAEAYFVDSSRESIKIISENIAKTKLEAKSKVLSMPALKACQKLLKQGLKFDLIYFDPPYAKFEQLLQELDGSYLTKLLQPKGILICEEDSYEHKDGENIYIPSGFELLRRCQYGQAMVSFYSRSF